MPLCRSSAPDERANGDAGSVSPLRRHQCSL